MITSTRERRLWWRHLLSILVAPVTMTLVIPALIVTAAGIRQPDLGSPAMVAVATVGGLLIVGGLGLMVWTIVLFDRIGKGTLGVGQVLGEPVHLVVRGPYRHVRNPMITGVLCVLLGEAAVTASGWLLGWFAVFFAMLRRSGSGKSLTSCGAMAPNMSSTGATFPGCRPGDDRTAREAR
jgi:protein-S-isoprenylcysteine O-methyltransferase Ste14